MSDETEAAEEALEKAKRESFLIPAVRNVKIFDAEQRLYRAQKREFEASIRRRAKAATQPKGK